MRPVPDTSFDRLITPRLTIRRFRADDAATFAQYRSDADVARYQSWDTPYTLAQAEQFVTGLAAAHPDAPGEWFQFAVEETASACHVGDVAAFIESDDPRLATVGVTLAPSAQGRGYATEALTALLDYLFGQRGKHRVSASCDTRNHASAALLERLGMRREAHHLANTWEKGAWTDEYVYAVLAEEWMERQGSG